MGAGVEHRKSFSELTEAEVHPATSVSAPEGFLTAAAHGDASAAAATSTDAASAGATTGSPRKKNKTNDARVAQFLKNVPFLIWKKSGKTQ